MEVTVLVDGRPKIISGVTEKTTCRELVTAIARFRSQPGTYTLTLMRDCFNDSKSALAPVSIAPNALILPTIRHWKHQIAARPQCPSSSCLVLILQQPDHVSSNSVLARRRRVMLQMETKEQAARLRVVTRLAKQLEAENRSLLLEAESYGDESLPPSKSLLADEFNRVSQEIKELEQAGLPELLLQQRETERSLRSTINRYRERVSSTEDSLREYPTVSQNGTKPGEKLTNGHVSNGSSKNGYHSHPMNGNGDMMAAVDKTVASVPAAQPVWV